MKINKKIYLFYFSLAEMAVEATSAPYYVIRSGILAAFLSPRLSTFNKKGKEDDEKEGNR